MALALRHRSERIVGYAHGRARWAPVLHGVPELFAFGVAGIAGDRGREKLVNTRASKGAEREVGEQAGLGVAVGK